MTTNLRVEIKNLGKLADADIRIGKFTVFAGANNTGKSFVSKGLYSIFGAMNANHLAVVFNPLIDSLIGIVERIESDRDEIENEREEKFESEQLDAMIKAVKELHKVVNSISIVGETDEISVIDGVLPKINNLLIEIENIFPNLKPELEDFIENFHSDFDERSFDNDDINTMEESIKEISSLKNQKSKDIVERGLEQEVNKNLLGNFQVNNSYNLCKAKNDIINFRIDNICDIKIQNNNCTLDIDTKGVQQLQKYSRVLYLESPVFWRLKNPLESVRRMPPWFYSRRQRFSGVPKYFYDMVNVIRDKYSGDSICPEVVEKLTSLMGGRVVVDENGSLVFQETDVGAFPLSLAAMGIANMGMLGLLIESNVLDKDTFLFIDEPEAHLHPAWQVEITESLFKLAEKGVNVVIATHSADILKWIEVHVKENPKAEEIIALNHFRVGGVVKSNGESFDERCNAIQEELTDPYYKLFYKEL